MPAPTTEGDCRPRAPGPPTIGGSRAVASLAAIVQFGEPPDRVSFHSAHAFVMALRDRDLQADATGEALDQVRDVGWRDLHLAVRRVTPLARLDNVSLIRDRRSRSFREELRERDSLLAIPFLAHVAYRYGNVWCHCATGSRRW